MQADFRRKVPSALENLLNGAFAFSGSIRILLIVAQQADLSSASTVDKAFTRDSNQNLGFKTYEISGNSHRKRESLRKIENP